MEEVEIDLVGEKLTVLGNSTYDEKGERYFTIDRIKYKGRNITDLFFGLEKGFPSHKTIFLPATENVKFMIKEDEKWQEAQTLSRTIDLTNHSVLGMVENLVIDKLNESIFEE